MLQESANHKDPLQSSFIKEPIQTTFLPEKDAYGVDKKLKKHSKEMLTLLEDITDKKKFKRVHKIVEKFRRQTLPVILGHPLKITDLRDGRKVNQSDYLRSLLIQEHQRFYDSMYNMKHICYKIMRNFVQ